MGRDFYDTYRAAKAVFEKADAILGYAFSELIFNGSAEELTQTKNSQLAIFITSIAILRAVEEAYPQLKSMDVRSISMPFDGWNPRSRSVSRRQGLPRTILAG